MHTTNKQTKYSRLKPICHLICQIKQSDQSINEPLISIRNQKISIKQRCISSIHQVVFSCTGLKKNCTLSFFKILNFELKISLVEFSLRCIPTIFFVHMAYLIHAFSAHYQDLLNHPFGYIVKAFCYTLQSKASRPLG